MREHSRVWTASALRRAHIMAALLEGGNMNREQGATLGL